MTGADPKKSSALHSFSLGAAGSGATFFLTGLFSSSESITRRFFEWPDLSFEEEEEDEEGLRCSVDSSSLSTMMALRLDDDDELSRGGSGFLALEPPTEKNERMS